MADDPSDKIPKAIKNHAPQQNYEMKGPDGSAIRKAQGEKQVHQDFAKERRASAQKYANIEKEKIASKEQVREGQKGNLSKDYNNERER